MTFRLARETEKDIILALYKAVIGTEFCVWNDEYPGLQEITKDIATDNLFVLESAGLIAGAISIVPENELDDLKCWSSNRNTGEFARVVIHPDFHGRHYAKLLVSNVLEVMKKRGIEAVHISVAINNIPAYKTYQKLGFKTAGQNEMWKNKYYLCELILGE